MTRIHWRLILDEAHHGAYNMALDEALLMTAAARHNSPALRLYAWDPATLSLGFAQPSQDIDMERLQTLGWGLVPPTLYRRRKLPLGPGSLQVFIPHDPERHYFTLNEAERQRLKPVARFDELVNNADRKGSHILFDAEDHLWAIDLGLCFHVVPKLRTVIWDFAGQELPTDLLADVEKLAAALQPADSELRASLQPLLRPAEVNALLRRARALLNAPFFPQPNPRERPYPWPVV